MSTLYPTPQPTSSPPPLYRKGQQVRVRSRPEITGTVFRDQEPNCEVLVEWHGEESEGYIAADQLDPVPLFRQGDRVFRRDYKERIGTVVRDQQLGETVVTVNYIDGDADSDRNVLVSNLALVEYQGMESDADPAFKPNQRVKFNGTGFIIANHSEGTTDAGTQPDDGFVLVHFDDGLDGKPLSVRCPAGCLTPLGDDDDDPPPAAAITPGQKVQVKGNEYLPTCTVYEVHATTALVRLPLLAADSNEGNLGFDGEAMAVFPLDRLEPIPPPAPPEPKDGGKVTFVAPVVDADGDTHTEGVVLGSTLDEKLVVRVEGCDHVVLVPFVNIATAEPPEQPVPPCPFAGDEWDAARIIQRWWAETLAELDLIQPEMEKIDVEINRKGSHFYRVMDTWYFGKAREHMTQAYDHLKAAVPAPQHDIPRMPSDLFDPPDAEDEHDDGDEPKPIDPDALARGKKAEASAERVSKLTDAELAEITRQVDEVTARDALTAAATDSDPLPDTPAIPDPVAFVFGKGGRSCP